MRKIQYPCTCHYIQGSKDPRRSEKRSVIPFLFLDDGKGFRIVQNGSRQKT